MSGPAAKPVPVPTSETAEYWAGARRHELLIQRCRACGRHQFYPRALCTACSARDVEWVRASGLATVRSFTVVRRAVSEAYAAEVPYIAALVSLDEGPVMMTNIIDCAAGDVRIGMRVAVRFERWTEDITMPKFAPVS
jgi:uncharacterized protein